MFCVGRQVFMGLGSMLKFSARQTLPFMAVAMIFVLLAFSSMAQAQIIFAPSVAYNYEKVSDSAGVVSGNMDSRLITMDLRLAYQFQQNGFLAGGMYKIETDSYSNGDLKGYALGPSVGWSNNTVSVVASYFLMAERKYTFSNQETKLSSGSGFQMDFAFTPQVATNFGFGPQLTYRSIKYTKTQTAAGPETSNAYETSVLMPYFAFWFVF